MTKDLHTVTGLTRRIRDALWREIGSVWVSGEVSNCRPAASGHIYFTLKDARAQLSCVLFQSDAEQVIALPEDGLEVEMFGKVDVYEARGQYQMIVRQVQTTGAGSLQIQFEKLKRKLHAEGLFDSSRKKPIPRAPMHIAVVTSPTGAAIRDILHVLERRAPWVRVSLFPVRVQGEGAGTEIAEAIRLVDQLATSGQLPVETLIVGRGGGSIEDLWAFNEEIVARALAECSLPVVSAVGHEIDVTISDHIADLRAPTPSAAAEVVAPDGNEVQERLRQHGRRLERRVQERMAYLDERLEEILPEALAREPRRLLRDHEQTIDHLGDRLRGAPGMGVARLRERVDDLSRVLSLHRPETVLAGIGERVLSLRGRLHEAIRRQLHDREQQLEAKTSLLQSLGPEATLSRGFALVVDAKGKLVTRTGQVKKGDVITTRLSDGEIDSEVR